MITESTNLLNWLMGATKYGEFFLSDGRWFISDGQDSREVNTAEISAMYSASLNKRKKRCPELESLFNEMAAIWGISADFLREFRRSYDRPVMRALFYKAAKCKFPTASLKQLGEICNTCDHTTVRKALINLDRWLSVHDATVMSYYNPVAHLMKEKADICQKEVKVK